MDIKECANQELGKIENLIEKKKTKLNVIKMANVRSVEVDWLWSPYIAKGKLTILEGEEGIGKSWLCCSLSAGVSKGKLFNHEPFEPTNVLLLSAEDGLGDTIRPRLDMLDADNNRIFAIKNSFVFDDKAFTELKNEIYERKADLVIIDPLFAYIGAGVDINQANKCRAITSKLSEIAEQVNCSIIGVRHIGKTKGGGDARAAGLGSIDIRAAARSVLLIGKDPDDDSRRAMFQTKNNLTKLGKPIGYEIKDDKFQWTGDTSLTIDQVLGTPSNYSNRREQSEIIDFLKEVLKDGEKPAKEIKQEASELGFTEQKLKTARLKLGIHPRKKGGNFSKNGKQGWFWKLPD